METRGDMPDSSKTTCLPAHRAAIAHRGLVALPLCSNSYVLYETKCMLYFFS